MNRNHRLAQYSGSLWLYENNKIKKKKHEIVRTRSNYDIQIASFLLRFWSERSQRRPSDFSTE